MRVLNDYKEGFKKYTVFSGVSNRQEFLNFIVPNIAINILIDLLALYIEPIGILSFLFGLIVFVPTIAICIRRLHDVGKSGLYILIPIYNIILLFRQSNKENNIFNERVIFYNNNDIAVKIPLWLKLINFMNLIPIIAWPLVFFASIFIFDNPHNMLYAFGLFLIMNSYPLILIGSLFLSFRLYKIQKRQLSIVLPFVVLIGICFTLYEIFK